MNERSRNGGRSPCSPLSRLRGLAAAWVKVDARWTSGHQPPNARTIPVVGAYLSWALADQLLVSGSNFFTSILLARFLGIEEFGRYVLAWTVFLFVQNIQYSAISTAMLSVGPKQDEHSAKSYFNTIFLHQAIFGVVSALVIWFGGMLLAMIYPSAQLKIIAMPLAAVVLCCQTQDFLRRYFFSITRPFISFVVDAIRYLGQLVVLLMLFTVTKDATNTQTVLWVLAGAAALASLATIRRLPSWTWPGTAALSISWRSWHFSKWLVASALLAWAMGNVFFLAAGALLGTAAVGALKASQSLVGMAHIVIETAVNVLPTRAAQEFSKGGFPRLAAYLRHATLRGTAATALLAGAFAITPQFWLERFFGPEFTPYGNLVRWWAAIELVIFLGLAAGTWLRTLEKTKVIFHAYAVSTFVSIVLLYPLLTNLGATGGAVAILVGFLVQLMVMYLGIAETTRSPHRAGD